MSRILIAVALFAVTASSLAQGASCICTSGCVLTANPVPPGPNAPTLCTAYKAGVLYASTNVVLASTIPISNAAHCFPADPNYNPGVAGSVACAVNIPPLIPGTYTLTLTMTNVAGETAQSAPFIFTSVASLPSILPTPTGIRIAHVEGTWVEDAEWDVRS